MKANGIKSTYRRKQFPIRIANQGSTIHAFNGITTDKLQICISYNNQDYNYWALEQVISAHGRTRNASDITYAPPPNEPDNDNWKEDIILSILTALSKAPVCGREFIKYLGNLYAEEN